MFIELLDENNNLCLINLSEITYITFQRSSKGELYNIGISFKQNNKYLIFSGSNKEEMKKSYLKIKKILIAGNITHEMVEKICNS